MVEEPDRTCPDCGKGSIYTRVVEEQFNYGDLFHPDRALLSCNVPVRICLDCGMQYTDYVGEGIREETVNAYLYSIGKGRSREWSPRWKDMRCVIRKEFPES